MQETQIILHIRSIYFRSKFIEISDHVSKPKLYYIENQVLLIWQACLVPFLIDMASIPGPRHIQDGKHT